MYRRVVVFLALVPLVALGCYGPPVAPREASCKDFRFIDTTLTGRSIGDTVLALGRVCVR